MRTCPHCHKSLIPEATPMERKVLLLLADGLTHAEIAAKLESSPRTVSAHVYNLHRKWGVKGANAIALVREAIRRGIIAYDGDTVVERSACDNHQP